MDIKYVKYGVYTTKLTLELWNIFRFLLRVRERARVCVRNAFIAYEARERNSLAILPNLINFLERISNWLLDVLFITDFDFTALLEKV
jgi:hypothetical protein